MRATGLLAVAVAVPAVTVIALLGSLVLLAPDDPSEWVNPLSGQVGDGFGWRISPVTNEPEFHTGQDIAAPCGSPIVAAHAGTVTFAGPDSGFGHLVVLDHGGSVSTEYGHMYADEIFVQVGERVQEGEEIAEVGNDGQSTGCHLHFEVRVSGSPVDPFDFADEVGIELGD